MADSNRTISIRMALEDNDFKTKLKSLSNEMNVFKSELAKVESLYVGQQNSLAALTAKYNVYEKLLANLNERIKTYSDKNDQLRRSLVDLQATREKQTQSLEEYKKKLEQVQSSLGTYKEQHERVEKSFINSTGEYNRAKDALKAFEEQYTGTTRNFPWYKQKHDELAKAVEEAGVKQEYWRDALKTTDYNVQSATERSAEYDAEIKKLVNDLISLDNQERDVNKAINDNDANANRAQVTWNKYAAVVEILKEAMKEAGQSTDGTAHSINRFSGELEKADEATEALAQKLAVELVKKGFDVVKEAVTSSVNAFKEYETALAGVSKTTGMEWGGEAIKALGDDFKALSQQMPVSAKELLNVAQIAGQLGIQGSEDIQKFTKVMAQMSVSTNLSAEEAATALAQMAAVTGMAASDYDKLGSAIVALGNKFPTAEDTIVRIAQRFSGAAVNASLAESSIVALAAAAGSVGLQAESAGTSLSKLVQKMGDAVQSGDAVTEWAKVANMSAEEFTKLWSEDAAQAIAKFLDGFGKLGPQASATFKDLGIGEARLQDLIRRMANAEDASGLLTRALREANDAFAEGVALENEASVAFKTLNSQMTIFQNSVDVLGIEVGTALAPQLTALVQTGTDIVQFVTNMIQEFPGIVYGLEAITIAIGVMTIKALPEAIPLIGKTIDGFKGLAQILTNTNWSGAFSAVSDGIAFLTTASVGTVAAIGGVVAALVLLAIAIAKYSEEGDVATKKTQHASEAYETQEEVAKALAEAEDKLAEIKEKYNREEEECGQVTQDTSDELDTQQAIVDALKEAYDALPPAIEEATEAEEAFAYTSEEASQRIRDLTADFAENMSKVKDFSTTYKTTASDYIKEIQQQIEWNETYTANREKLLARDIDGLVEWVATWDDGSAEAAEKMAAFANASDEDIKSIIQYLNDLAGAASENAASVEKEYQDAFDNIHWYAKDRVNKIQLAIDSLHGKDILIRVNQAGIGTYDAINAQGLDYVPFDGFVSMLHEGERVLNRAEASAYRTLERTTNNNTTNNSNITLNVYGAQGQSVDEISNVVMRKIQNATNRRQAVWA